MKITKLQLTILHEDFAHCDFLVHKATISTGIGILPTMTVEATLLSKIRFDLADFPNLRGTRLLLEAQQNLTASGTASVHAMSLHYSINDVHVSLSGNEISSVKLQAQLWPDHSDTNFTKGNRYFLDKTSIEIAKEICPFNSVMDNQDEAIKLVKSSYECQYMESNYHFLSRILAKDGLLFYIDSDIDDSPSLKIFSKISQLPSSDLMVWTVSHLEQSGNIPLASVGDVMYVYPHAPTSVELASYNSDLPNVDLRAVVNADDSMSRSQPRWIHVDIDNTSVNTRVDDSANKAQRMLDSKRDQQIFFKSSDLRLCANRVIAIKNVDGTEKTTEVGIIASRLEFTHNMSNSGWTLVSSHEARLKQSGFCLTTSTKPSAPSVLRGIVVKKDGDKLKPDFSQNHDHDEVHADEFGRIRVRILWSSSTNSSRLDSDAPWIRLMTPFAGQRSGFFALPRVGQEVMVGFIDGDINQPIVMGSVYSEIKNSFSSSPWPITSSAADAMWVGFGAGVDADANIKSSRNYFRLDGSPAGSSTNGIELYSKDNININTGKRIIIGGVNSAESISLNAAEINNNASSMKVSSVAASDEWTPEKSSKIINNKSEIKNNTSIIDINNSTVTTNNSTVTTNNSNIVDNNSIVTRNMNHTGSSRTAVGSILTTEGLCFRAVGFRNHFNLIFIQKQVFSSNQVQYDIKSTVQSIDQKVINFTTVALEGISAGVRVGSASISIYS